MTATAPPVPVRTARAQAIGGWALSTLVILFLVMDGVMKVLQLPVVVSTTTQLGYPAGVIPGLGVTILAIAALYALPRTAVLGALLMTALLGGTVATHIRVESPLFSHVLFGVYLAAMAWGGLWLRDPRVRSLVPLRR